METWILFALISMLFAGLTSVLAKFGLMNVSADLGLAVRTSIVFVVVLLNLIVFTGVKEVPHLTAKNIFFLVLSGLTTSLSWIFYYKAIKMGDVSMIASIDKGSLIITIVLSYIFLKEPLTPKILVGGGLMLAGLLVLVWK